ncbi:uncharacterized protein [Rutidosis leptorrhynchoides]|uniref:uncharacterized protein n=1 Tax=Rutidosis leptorrhynchoides TaxID=125765 RepID=UPI003A9914EF
MYSTIAKSNGNNDKTIANMIIAGFTGQLKGWWDNYLKPEDHTVILNTVKTENNEVVTQAVYTLVVNIIEHFTGRWSDNSDTIRTLLNGLRCPTLTSFRWYKDTFLSRVMELSDSNSNHWKSKLIDGLPSLFAERVRNSIRGNEASIRYENFTYGKLIGVCVQEGHYANKCKVKKKINSLNINDELKEGLSRILLLSDNTDSENDISESDNGSIEENIQCLEDESLMSDTDCDCKNSISSDNEIYKIQAQFENLQISVLNKDTYNLIKDIKDSKSKIKLIEKLLNEEASTSEPMDNLPNTQTYKMKKHYVNLPYEDDFDEKQIPTKARPCQMNSEYLQLCKREIQSLMEKKLIRPSKSQWSCTAFYVNKHAEQERGVPRLDDLYNQQFIIRTDCQSAKFMFTKDFKHDDSKQMFARWQAHLAPFDFQIIYKKGEENSIPDFLTREFLQE